MRWFNAEIEHHTDATKANGGGQRAEHALPVSARCPPVTPAAAAPADAAGSSQQPGATAVRLGLAGPAAVSTMPWASSASPVRQWSGPKRSRLRATARSTSGAPRSRVRCRPASIPGRRVPKFPAPGPPESVARSAPGHLEVSLQPQDRADAAQTLGDEGVRRSEHLPIERQGLASERFCFVQSPLLRREGRGGLCPKGRQRRGVT